MNRPTFQEIGLIAGSTLASPSKITAGRAAMSPSTQVGEGGTAMVGYSCPSRLTPTLSPPGSLHAFVALVVAISAAVGICGFAVAQPVAPTPQQPPAKMTIGFVEIE